MVNRNVLVWCLLFFGVLVWSLVNPKDYFTWGLEVFPAIIAFVVMVFTYKTFP